MRSGLAGLFAAGGLITALFLVWIGLRPAPGRVVGESPWQLRELSFLKAAYDRTQQDVAQQNMAGQGEASASLYAEQERIVRQMKEAARLLPPEIIPEELRALLRDPGTAPAPGSRLIEALEANQRIPDLRVGWRVANGRGSHPIAHSAEFVIDPELREPIRAEPVASGPSSRRKPRDGAGRDQR
jgi:hypothetical protein